MDSDEKVYYRSDAVTVTRSSIVIQPYTGRGALLDWLLGHPGELTLAMQSVCSITVSKPSKLLPVLVIGIGALLVPLGGTGVPILAIGIPWLWYLLKFGTKMMVLTPAGAGDVYGDVGVDEQERVIEAVRSALADRG